MNYKETLDWMFSQLPMYQNLGKKAFKKDLTNSVWLSEHLNFPEEKFKSIHIAGTNGKGSTSHMIASILQEAGYKVGLYTSPHLKDYRERIKIDGKPISEEEVLRFISTNMSFFDTHELSFFEMTVGLAFDCFAKHEVDIALIEVGLGGRLDSTNIITPLVSVITNIGLDHTQMLGETLAEIAFEKAGIIKTNVPVVVGEYQKEIHSVFYEKAMESNASLFVAQKNIANNYETDLQGLYQKNNMKTAVQTINILQDLNFEIPESVIEIGLNKVVWNTGLLGRWQVLENQPLTICDIAHNREGLLFVLKQLQTQKYKKLHIVLGVVNDKDLNRILPLFPIEATYYFCRPNIPRGLNAEALKLICSAFNLKGNAFETVNTAFYAAKENANLEDVIYIGGSTFVVAEVL